MEISIQHDEKTSNFSLINSWSDVSLENYARLIKYSELSGAQKSLHTIALCTDIPKHLIKRLDVVSLGNILSIINKLQQEDEGVFTNIFTHNDIQYGIIPDLSAITLGEYVDLESLVTRDLVDNMPKIAAILFRPVVDIDGDTYTIEAYEPNSAKMRAKAFKTMSGVQVQNALVFFWNLGSALLNASGLSSEIVIQEMKNLKR